MTSNRNAITLYKDDILMYVTEQMGNTFPQATLKGQRMSAGHSRFNQEKRPLHECCTPSATEVTAQILFDFPMATSVHLQCETCMQIL